MDSCTAAYVAAWRGVLSLCCLAQAWQQAGAGPALGHWHSATVPLKLCAH